MAGVEAVGEAVEEEGEGEEEDLTVGWVGVLLKEESRISTAA